MVVRDPSRGVTMSFGSRSGGVWLGLSVVAAIAIGACSVDLDEAQTVHDHGVAIMRYLHPMAATRCRRVRLAASRFH